MQSARSSTPLRNHLTAVSSVAKAHIGSADLIGTEITLLGGLFGFVDQPFSLTLLITNRVDMSGERQNRRAFVQSRGFLQSIDGLCKPTLLRVSHALERESEREIWFQLERFPRELDRVVVSPREQ